MPLRYICCRFLVVFCVLAGAQWAQAGGLHIREDTITINGGTTRTFKPGENVSVSFEAIDYEYGSNEFKSIYLAVIPAAEKISKATKARAQNWRLFYARMRDAAKSYSTQNPLRKGETAEDYHGLMHITMNFSAPTTPGTYQLAYNPIPAFTNHMPAPDANLKEVVEIGTIDRQTAVAPILPYAAQFTHFLTFKVSNEKRFEDTLTLYLRANGTQPIYADIRGGLVDKPLEFSWHVGPEFKLDRNRILYRYKLFPIDDEFSAWTTETNVKFHFLQRGTLNFAVEAKYTDKESLFQSQPARFNFILLDHLVAKATRETLYKGPDEKQIRIDGKVIDSKISFSEVYASSRALIIGIHQFTDNLFFREFPRDKIQSDVDTLEKSLIKNDFKVTKLFKDKLTRGEIMKAIDDLVDNSDKNDRLFIYFSSHGFADKNSPNEGYIATTDCSYSKPSSDCIRLSDIGYQAKRALEGRKVRQVLIAVDSCFSGLGVVSKAAGIPDFSKLAVPPGAYMITAGMADQLAQIDPELKMSTFTHYLAKGLEGEANIFDKNGIISLTELFLYTQYNVARQTDSKQIPMLGRLIGDGEMLFRPNK